MADKRLGPFQLGKVSGAFDTYEFGVRRQSLGCSKTGTPVRWIGVAPDQQRVMRHRRKLILVIAQAILETRCEAKTPAVVKVLQRGLDQRLHHRGICNRRAIPGVDTLAP